MAVSLRESVDVISDPRNLDASVEEVFQTMLGVNCERVSNMPSHQQESVTAVVGFGGLLSGACVFRSDMTTALKIAGRLTGMDLLEMDDTVKDAYGEICNMLAGTWKARTPNLSGHCGLSIPAVITGRDYDIHVQAPEFRVQHFYRFEDACFDVTIICDGLK